MWLADLGFDHIADKEEITDILEEAGAIRCVLMNLEAGVSDDDNVTAALLTELQDVQDREIAEALMEIHTWVSRHRIRGHHQACLVKGQCSKSQELLWMARLVFCLAFAEMRVSFSG